MVFRKAMRYPPLISLVNTIVRARTFSAAMDDASDIAEKVRMADRGLRILGPAPAPLGRLRGEYRAQVLVKGTNRKAIRACAFAPLPHFDQCRCRIRQPYR